jgi:hypothetical protein
MTIIRKISIGNDLLNAMHFQVGKPVMQGNYTVYDIIRDTDGSFDIWVEKEGEAVKWKTIGPTVAVSIEYNIDF